MLLLSFQSAIISSRCYNELQLLTLFPVDDVDEGELLHQLRRLACYDLTHELLVESQIALVVGFLFVYKV
jgi:hypothetical protein